MQHVAAAYSWRAAVHAEGLLLVVWQSPPKAQRPCSVAVSAAHQVRDMSCVCRTEWRGWGWCDRQFEGLLLIDIQQARGLLRDLWKRGLVYQLPARISVSRARFVTGC